MLRLFIFNAFLSLNAAQLLVPRQLNAGTGNTYLDSVCLPAVAKGETIPPCISISTIETQCLPNGTTTLDYSASAQCLCNAPSTFFLDWIGCRGCLLIHGGISQLDLARATSVLDIVSSAMCGANASPTAEFAAIYSSVNVAFPNSLTGGTAKTDSAPSSTAVSLYYTAPGPQGHGVISGSATGATATATTTTTGTDAKTTTRTDTTPTTTPKTLTSTDTGTKTGTSNGGSTTSSSEVQATDIPMAAAAAALVIAVGAAALL